MTNAPNSGETDTRLQPIGIRDLSQITKYQVSVLNGDTLHYAEFINGGHLYLYLTPGTQPKVTSEGLDCEIGSNGTLFFPHIAHPDESG